MNATEHGYDNSGRLPVVMRVPQARRRLGRQLLRVLLVAHIGSARLILWSLVPMASLALAIVWQFVWSHQGGEWDEQPLTAPAWTQFESLAGTTEPSSTVTVAPVADAADRNAGEVIHASAWRIAEPIATDQNRSWPTARSNGALATESATVREIGVHEYNGWSNRSASLILPRDAEELRVEVVEDAPPSLAGAHAGEPPILPGVRLGVRLDSGTREQAKSR